MGFVALLLALIAEQMRPLPRDNLAHRGFAAVVDRVAALTNAGQRLHGVVGWFAVVGSALVAVLLAQWVAASIGAIAVLALHALVLYHTVGLRQFSHAFTEIQLALAANDPDGARQALQRWVRLEDPEYVVGDMPVAEVCRQAIARALVAAHRHVFGPLFWYMLLPGAIGPVLYRAAQFVADRWKAAPARPAEAALLSAAVEPAPAVVAGEPYGDFAQQAYAVIDWLPVRLASAGFAIVGNFEDAVYCWRAAAANRRAGASRSNTPWGDLQRGGDPQRRILLMAGGGALGIRIADPRIEADVRGAGSTAATDDDPSLTGGAPAGGFDWQGAEPDAAGLRSAAALVWRSLVLWILLFAMVTIANWLGR
jgi:adenosylcobinamide-phosphate synthase